MASLRRDGRGGPAAMMSTGRLEAFSDGVIAVAITLLVLDIRVPDPSPHHTLAHELAQQWPNYAAYATSFITIGIIWINHHVMIGRLRTVDYSTMILNLLLLLSIGVLPFVTSLMARYLRAGAGDHLAAGVFAAAFLMMGVVFSTMQHHILIRHPQLLKGELSEAQRRRILRNAASGVIPYVLALALALVSAYATLIICSAVAVFFAFPFAAGAGVAADADA